MAITATTMTKAMCQTDIYKQYKHLTDVKVICIMKFPINDTTTTAITLFVPKTKEAVWPLVEEFNLELDKEEVCNRFGKEERYSLYTYNVRKEDVKKMFGEIKSEEDYKNMERLVYSYNTGTIMIFHDIETKERYRIINRFIIKVTKQPELLPKLNEEK